MAAIATFRIMIFSWFAGLPPEIPVTIVAALPIGELRAAIPLGLALGLLLWTSVFWSVIGNAVPIALIYAGGNLWLAIIERKKGFFHRLTDRVLKRTHAVFAGRYGKYGLAALVVFVAIPLPLFGAWSGTLAAFAFGVPFKKAFPLVFLGNLIAAAIVSAALTGGTALFRAFL